MRAPEEIRSDLDAVDVTLAEHVAAIEAEREKVREAAKLAMSMIGKQKRAAVALKSKLEHEFGKAMLAKAREDGAAPEVPLVGGVPSEDG